MAIIMNETINNIKTRRSIKKYQNKMIPEDILNEILTAATYSPSGKNLQSSIIVAITNKEVRDKLSRLNAKVMNTDIDPFYGAPIVAVVLGNKEIPTYIYDGSLVMGNLMTAAHSLGISSCWIHRAKEVFETEEGKEILKTLGIEGNYEGIGNCILGYSDETKIPSKRKEDYIYYIK